MFKLLTRLLVLTALVFTAGYARAIEERHAFDVSVTIPVHEAYVLPSEPDWMGQEQELAWNLVTSQLSRLRKNFDVKNLSGGVAARLGAEPYLFNGRYRIDLRVLFNQVPLTLDSTEVVNAAEAQIGRRAELEIAAIEPDEGYKPGEYYGTVHIVFDFLAP
ncbi:MULTISPECIES: CS1 type fimbrial major subunit [Pseudomonas]|nr:MULTISPECIES: CS1 type fimbrial major subunit [Pseudomonas]AVJ41026.1 fimbrial assembly protein [Pseudomonas lurida]MBC3922249.1 fimbrial assembly protein [Pseudomonas lurida]PRA18985.1 fimbrial assembly protein [Pseudomonas sp. MYb13]PRA24692.1 fimbrial assembly protein [Pseudomonas lurida]PRA39377.1 fimbrial assembly protein [Pseudomonas lurida]